MAKRRQFSSEFKAKVATYAGQRMRSFLEWAQGDDGNGGDGGDGGGPIDPDEVTREEFDALEARVSLQEIRIATLENAEYHIKVEKVPN